MCVRACYGGRTWDLPTGRWPVGAPTPGSPQHAEPHPPPRAAQGAHHRGCSRGGEPSLEGWASTATAGRWEGPGAVGPGRGGTRHGPRRSLCCEGQDPAPTSTKASVRSLARSITGKWRPATIFTFSFPGIVSASASPGALAETNKRACAERQPGGGGGGAGARGERRAPAGARGVTDGGGRARARVGAHARRRRGAVPRPPRPHSGEAAGGGTPGAPLGSSIPVPQAWLERRKPVSIPLSLRRRYMCSFSPQNGGSGAGRKHRPFGALGPPRRGEIKCAE